VTLEKVLDVAWGDEIAVRTDEEPFSQVLTGRVRSTLADVAVPEEVIEECESAIGLSVEVDVWWELPDGETINRSDELEDRPSTREHPSDPPKDPLSCSLSYREGGRIGLTIPMPVNNGSRVLNYALDDFGTIVVLNPGSIVDPDRLLPSN